MPTDARTPVHALYWWNGKPNFGDGLSPSIATSLLGWRLPLARRSVHAGVPVLFAIGSILQFAKSFDETFVWGTGLDPHYGEVRTRGMRILAVRGPRSAELLGTRCEVFGDPALLLPAAHPIRAVPGDVAVIPHHSTMDFRLRDFLWDPRRAGYRIIDPRRNWLAVAEDLCRSRFVFCQSLHAAILAHAYGIPWAWWKGWHGRWATFKWEDWFASIGVKPAAFRLGQLAEAERWAAKTRARTPDLVALRQALVENVRVANLGFDLERPASVHPRGPVTAPSPSAGKRNPTGRADATVDPD